MKLTPRRLATVLASLRYWQESVRQEDARELDHFSDECTPLSDMEIDTLCEGLNSTAATERSDDELRYLTRSFGGTFHGPNVEHVSMEEQAYFRLLRFVDGSSNAAPDLLSASERVLTDIELMVCHRTVHEVIGNEQHPWHQIVMDLRAAIAKAKAPAAKANALNLAAPNLLEACEQAEHWLATEYRNDTLSIAPNEILRVLRAGIARAKQS